MNDDFEKGSAIDPITSTLSDDDPITQKSEPSKTTPADTYSSVSSSDFAPASPAVCRNCGELLIPGKKFCASCGTPVDFSAPSSITITGEPVDVTTAPHKSKLPLLAGIAGFIVIVVIVLIVIFSRETPATSLAFTDDTYAMPIGEQQTLEYTIQPEKSAKNKLTWESSDTSIATVNKSGTITAVAPGSCTITATTKNDITASLSLTVGALVDAVQFRDEEVSVKEENTLTLVCTVSPGNAYDKTLTWESSNTSVADVNEDGVVMGVAEGTCVITATSANGLSDTCVVNVEPGGPNFSQLYYDYCDSPWATLADDGSYLKIDSNPYDTDSDDFTSTEYEYLIESDEAIQNINKALGVPDSIYERMNTTTALQGVQTADYETFTISWSYHPDNGLQVMYELY